MDSFPYELFYGFSRDFHILIGFTIEDEVFSSIAYSFIFWTDYSYEFPSCFHIHDFS